AITSVAHIDRSIILKRISLIIELRLYGRYCIKISNRFISSGISLNIIYIQTNRRLMYVNEVIFNSSLIFIYSIEYMNINNFLLYNNRILFSIILLIL
ncbi:unnamed protein product, partial [Heterotrigona itama]